MKTKTWLWIVVSALAAAGAVWWLWRPQTFTLNDGTKLKLVGVEYGKHHKFPGERYEVSAYDGTNDTLYVWIEQKHKGNDWPNYQLYAYDKSGTACVGMFTRNSRQIRPGDEMIGFQLDAFPRRQGKFYLRIQEWSRQSGRQNMQPTIKNGFVISNPARGHFPAWLPDSLPNTQEDGDLSVTLNRLEFGAKAPYTRNPKTQNDPMNKGVLVAFQIQQNGKTATNWQPAQVETSDATGNHITGWCNSHWTNDEEVTLYQYGLWPDEPAWKLRAEFSRTSGFHNDELWTVQNVPLEPGRMQDFWNYGRDRTNSAFAETTLNGIHLKLFPAKQFTDQRNMRGSIEGGLAVQTDLPLDGMRLTLIEATDDQGHKIKPMTWSWGGTDYRFGLQELGNPRSLNLTLALHRSRFVEFTAKPTKP
jgi:hypothetical protein